MSANKKIKRTALLCDKLNFVMHEEYRLLRTNIKYSLTDDKTSHIIGVTSSVKGEAKTTTAINLAYTLAENGDSVCLVEGDMRIPTFKKKMGITFHKGLSEFLTGQADFDEVVEDLTFGQFTFACIQSGVLPPNPSELLASSKMDKLLTMLSEKYSYIIVDLPPVDVVSDAIVLGGKLHGMIMVVAQPICTKRLLKESMRQLIQARIKILGFVRTMISDRDFSYSRRTRANGKYRRDYQYAKYEYGSKAGENR